MTVVDGAPGCSTCCSTGSGMRLWKVSPGSRSSGSRFASAAPAAVTMFVAPGPIEDVATMICCRRIAFANASAASAIPCSFWARCVGRRSRASSRALPRPSTFPCPKIANTPGNSGTSSSSTIVRCAMRKRTIAWAVVSLTVSMSVLSQSSSDSADRVACAAHVSRIQPAAGRRRRPSSVRGRPRHHVEVVEGVAGSSGAGAVVAARDEEHVAVLTVTVASIEPSAVYVRWTANPSCA